MLSLHATACVSVCVYVCVSWRDDSGQSAGSLSCQPVTHWQICCSYTVQATPHGCTQRVCVCVSLCELVIYSQGIARIPKHVLHTQTPVCVSVSKKTWWRVRPLIYRLLNIYFFLRLHLHLDLIEKQQWGREEEKRERLSHTPAEL